MGEGEGELILFEKGKNIHYKKSLIKLRKTNFCFYASLGISMQLYNSAIYSIGYDNFGLIMCNFFRISSL